MQQGPLPVTHKIALKACSRNSKLVDGYDAAELQNNHCGGIKVDNLDSAGKNVNTLRSC